MTKEPVIQDKIHLLMEETGCDQGEAELAMASTGYDLEKAIRTIGVLLRNIVAVKGKFQLASKNLYGLLILIADTKHQNLFRVRAVVSYNPALYETHLSEDWYEFEKGLYTFRLWEGALQQVTQDLERVLTERLENWEGESFFSFLREGDLGPFQERFERILRGAFSDDRLSLLLQREELNLEQFRHIKPKGEEVAVSLRDGRALDSGSGESLLLEAELQGDPGGAPAHQVVVGDMVFVLLTDERDIGQYLSRLLGGRNEGKAKPVAAPVEEIRAEGDTLQFQVRLSVGVLSLAKVQKDVLLKIEKRPTLRWWNRLFPFL